MKAKGFWTRVKSHIKEIVFVGALLLTVSAVAIASTFWPRSLAGLVSVRLGGNEVVLLRLDNPRTYELQTAHGVMVIEVKDGKAGILSSPCPNQLCVKEGYKDQEGASIVCVPEEVSLYFLGSGEVSEVSL